MTTPSYRLLQQTLSHAAGGDAPSTMNAAGPAATSIAHLSTILVVSSSVVFAIVMGLLIWPFVRRPDLSDDAPRVLDKRRWEFRWIVVGGALAPMVILAGVFALSLIGMRDEQQPASPYQVDVIAHQWWWEIRYPNESVVTANEVHIPVGRPVRIHLASSDVIHSFWVPRLQGKTDAITGQVNETWLQANSEGVYRGECAEFCGIQHAHMAFVVVAQSPADYSAWLAEQRAPSAAPADTLAMAGATVFMTKSCAFCHTIRGTTAGAHVGPDLTHVASRRTLASATLDNSAENLAAWIEHPDRVKPGTRMPPVPLDGRSLHALVAYLETLH